MTLDISKVLDSVWHAGLFSNVSVMEFQVMYLALFLLFSVIDGLKWFRMGGFIRISR